MMPGCDPYQGAFRWGLNTAFSEDAVLASIQEATASMPAEVRVWNLRALLQAAEVQQGDRGRWLADVPVLQHVERMFLQVIEPGKLLPWQLKVAFELATNLKATADRIKQTLLIRWNEQFVREFGEDAVGGAPSLVALYRGPEPDPSWAPIVGTLADVIEHPEQYDLTPSQRALLAGWQRLVLGPDLALSQAAGSKVEEMGGDRYWPHRFVDPEGQPVQLTRKTVLGGRRQMEQQRQYRSLREALQTEPDLLPQLVLNFQQVYKTRLDEGTAVQVRELILSLLKSVGVKPELSPQQQAVVQALTRVTNQIRQAKATVRRLEGALREREKVTAEAEGAAVVLGHWVQAAEYAAAQADERSQVAAAERAERIGGFARAMEEVGRAIAVVVGQRDGLNRTLGQTEPDVISETEWRRRNPPLTREQFVADFGLEGVDAGQVRAAYEQHLQEHAAGYGAAVRAAVAELARAKRDARVALTENGRMLAALQRQWQGMAAAYGAELRQMGLPDAQREAWSAEAGALRLGAGVQAVATRTSRERRVALERQVAAARARLDALQQQAHELGLMRPRPTRSRGLADGSVIAEALRGYGFDPAFVKLVQDQFGSILGGSDTVAGVYLFFYGVKTMAQNGDFSPLTIQGMGAALQNPGRFLMSFPAMVHALMSPGYFRSYLLANVGQPWMSAWGGLRLFPAYDDILGPTRDIQQINEWAPVKPTQSKPVISGVLDAVEAFNMAIFGRFLNVLILDMARERYEHAIRTRGYSPEMAAREASKSVELVIPMVNYGRLGVKGGRSKLENAFLTSSSFLRAPAMQGRQAVAGLMKGVAATAAGKNWREHVTASEEQAIYDLIRYTLMTLSLSAGTAALAGKDVAAHLNPLDDDFGKIYLPWAQDSPIRPPGHLWPWVRAIFPKQRDDGQWDSWGEQLLRFGMARVAIGPKKAAEAIGAQSGMMGWDSKLIVFGDTEIERIGRWALNLAKAPLPIALQETIESVTYGDPMDMVFETFWKSLLQLGNPMSAGSRLASFRDEEARRLGAASYDEATPLQKREIDEQERAQELIGLRDAASARAAQAGSPFDQYMVALRNQREKYLERGRALDEEVQGRRITMREWREGWNKINAEKAAAMEAIDEDPAHAAVRQRLRSGAANKNDQALELYRQLFVLARRPGGGMDYEVLEQLETELMGQLDEEQQQWIAEQTGLGGTPLRQAYKRDLVELREFFQIEDSLAERDAGFRQIKEALDAARARTDLSEAQRKVLADRLAQTPEVRKYYEYRLAEQRGYLEQRPDVMARLKYWFPDLSALRPEVLAEIQAGTSLVPDPSVVPAKGAVPALPEVPVGPQRGNSPFQLFGR